MITALTVSTIVYDHPSKPSFQTVSIAAISENRNSNPKTPKLNILIQQKTILKAAILKIKKLASIKRC
jgi:hypothetical protein